MNSKPWWKSKTVWFNVLSVAIDVASGHFGFQIPAAAAVPILTGGNLALRMLTNSPITATSQAAQ